VALERDGHPVEVTHHRAGPHHVDGGVGAAPRIADLGADLVEQHGVLEQHLGLVVEDDRRLEGGGERVEVARLLGQRERLLQRDLGFVEPAVVGQRAGQGGEEAGPHRLVELTRDRERALHHAHGRRARQARRVHRVLEADRRLGGQPLLAEVGGEAVGVLVGRHAVAEPAQPGLDPPAFDQGLHSDDRSFTAQREHRRVVGERLLVGEGPAGLLGGLVRVVHGLRGDAE
jgi:hypothetical protein